ncbi:MAG: HD domain-containing protein [Desulfobacteraceae bacterium]|jgi:HD superfamily phosphohydrolase YqeK|nr:HD domain-containing protein [Desulfobacteraceae bacterium]
MKCPGQDSRYWKSDSIFEAKCPECGKTVEFFKDDTTRKCRHCGHRFANPQMDFGCAAYCKFAEQCLGSLPTELLAQRDDLLKDRIAIEMKRYFKTDFKRIGHASRVARYAQKIGMAEGGNMAVILASAYLHDIGIHEAERKHQSTAAVYQEQEGPAIARSIMEKLGASEDLIGEVCDIIGHHHHPREEETLNFKVIYDADLIVNIEDNQKEKKSDPEKIEKIINSSFFTENGKKTAVAQLLN